MHKKIRDREIGNLTVGGFFGLVWRSAMAAPLAYIALIDKKGHVRTHVPITSEIVYIGEYA